MQDTIREGEVAYQGEGLASHGAPIALRERVLPSLAVPLVVSWPPDPSCNIAGSQASRQGVPSGSGFKVLAEDPFRGLEGPGLVNQTLAWLDVSLMFVCPLELQTRRSHA